VCKVAEGSVDLSAGPDIMGEDDSHAARPANDQDKQTGMKSDSWMEMDMCSPANILLDSPEWICPSPTRIPAISCVLFPELILLNVFFLFEMPSLHLRPANWPPGSRSRPCLI
jgi:hypothetical protein